jgi:AAA15 family ATPase/GTPase
MAANSDASFEDSHVVKSDSSPRRLLKSAAIYGPNAGGKSNLIQAVNFMRHKILYSDDFHDGDNDCPPFRLDKSSRNTTSEFEMTFMLDDIRHQYGFSILGNDIMEEWLLVYRADKPQEWFNRRYDEKKGEDIFKFSSHFKGQKSAWQRSTRRDALFLSVAVKFNSGQLDPIFKWFRLLILITNTDSSRLRFNASHIVKYENARKEILSFITSSGIDISDIGVKTDTRKAPSQYEKKQGESFAETAELEIKTSRPVFIHNYGDGLTEEFELSEESIGTQRLFYLSPYILVAIKTGGVVVIDELESSMHPMLARFVVNCFNSAKNKNGAQLIFSTHNSSLLDIKEVLRRDQIWFAERDESQATVLYPLTDFNPRKEASVESGYLSGRYGAVPFLKDFYLDLDADEDASDGA